MEKNGERIIIGVLVGGIMDQFSVGICHGIEEMARTMDVDVIVLPGKYLNRDLSGNQELMYEYQYNTIFRYARLPQLNGIIIAEGSISCFATAEAVRAMIEEYEGIPCVLVSSKQEDYPTVNFDNKSGIREGLRYLIEQAGCTHLGMLGGPDGNSDARERREIFTEILKEYRLPYTPKQYVNAGYKRQCSKEAQLLLDQNPELEAVFCVNDDTALGLYEVLKQRGLTPGKDISVLGFDDTRLAARAEPPLASIKADPMELGNAALKLLMNCLNGRKCRDINLPTRFIRRGSIAEELSADKTVQSADINDKIDVYFGDIYYRYRNGEQADVTYRLRESFRRLLELVEDFAISDGVVDDQVRRIRQAADEYIRAGAITYADMGILLPNFQKIFRDLEKNVTDIRKTCELRQISSDIYGKMLQAMDNRRGTDMEERFNEDHQTKIFVRDTLSFEKGNDLSYVSMLSRLQWLGVTNAHVYIFPKTISHLEREAFEVPKKLYLKAYLRDGTVVPVPKLCQKIGREEMFRNSIICPDRRSYQVMLPLFSNENLYGIVCMDLTEKVFENGEFLVNQMSAAAKMIEVLRTNEQVQKKLEESLGVLKENNIALDNLSRIDAMTGVYNRRGFTDAAQRLIDEKRGRVLVIYVDMNNLKIINDRYGHDEGDYSIRLIAEILQKVVKNRGCAGRLGGDEFACALRYEAQDEGEAVLEEIYHQFLLHNKESDKPYNVTVSAGGCMVDEENGLLLQHALTQADERLYHVKMLRSKDVAKE